MAKAKDIQETEGPQYNIDTFLAFQKKLTEQTIRDPNKGSRSRSTSHTRYTREEINGYLLNPAVNELNLLKASRYMFDTSTRYKRLIESLAGIPMWSYVISPLNFSPDKLKTDSFKKAYYKVCNAVELMDLPYEGRNMLVSVLRDGVFYGVRWANSISSFIQQLEPEYCKIISITANGTFLFAYDCSRITEDQIGTSYPLEFQGMYDAYKTSGEKYQPVPAEISVCIKADPTTPQYSLPPYIGVMPSLYGILSAEEQAEKADLINNYKLIHGKIESDPKTGVPAIDYGTMQKYYQMLANNVSKHIGVAVTPFDIKDVTFDKSGSVTIVDTIARAVDNYWSTAGSSSVLHGAANKTAGVTKLSIKNEESYVLGLVYQIQGVVNRFLRTNFSGSNKFKVTFLPITIFNYEEMVGIYRNAIGYGFGKLYYAAALQIPQYDIDGLAVIENDIIHVDEVVTPMRSSNTLSSDDDVGGRQAMDETDLDEAGESTRENDTNANR